MTCTTVLGVFVFGCASTGYALGMKLLTDGHPENISDDQGINHNISQCGSEAYGYGIGESEVRPRQAKCGAIGDEARSVCPFDDPAHCHAEHPDGELIPIDEMLGLRGADDFRVTLGTTITDICWTAGFYAPGVGECADSPPADDWHVTFYYDTGHFLGDQGLPDEGNVVAARQPLIVDAKARRAPGSQLWDYQGHVESPLTIPDAGGCYWMELTGKGDGICVVYWLEGVTNEHCLSDNNGEYGPADARNHDYVFCLDAGMSLDDCGEVVGACCYCLPGGPGVCEEHTPRTECSDNGGTWLAGTYCDPNPCPGTPENDNCAEAIIVSGLATGYWPVSTGPQLYPLGNICATDDGPEHTNCLADAGDLTYDVWYSYIVEADGELTVSSCNLVNFDQMIAVYDVSDPSVDCSNVSQDHEIACGNDDCRVYEGPSEITIEVTAGQELHIRAGGWETSPPSGHSRGEGQISFHLECEPPPDPPVGCPGFPMNRALCFEDNYGSPIAYRLELLVIGDCHTHDCSPSVGLQWWVTKPRCTDEDGVDTTSVDPDCNDPGRTGVLPVWRAQLTVDPVCHGGLDNDLPCLGDDDCRGGTCGRGSWVGGDSVFIADCEIVPCATYELCPVLDPLALDPEPSGDCIILSSQVRPHGIRYFGDCVGMWNGAEWTPPDQEVTMDDVVAAIRFFKREFNAPHRMWVELNDRAPDMVLNFGDIQWIILGFTNHRYSLPCPADCPPWVESGWRSDAPGEPVRPWRPKRLIPGPTAIVPRP